MSDHAREILQTRYRLDRWAGAVGLQIEAVSDDRLRLRVPYSEDNMNLGGRLHGGVIATALVDAGKLLARWLASDASVEITPLDFQIFYLRAGGRHPVTAEVRLLRRTRTVLFLEGHAAHEDGRTLATAALSLRKRADASAFIAEFAGDDRHLVAALEVLEQLGEDVDHGLDVAATGELELDGAVAPVGGLKQKTIGAKEAGVDVFLVPAGDNAREARRYADGLRIIPVRSFQQALRALATSAG